MMCEKCHRVQDYEGTNTLESDIQDGLCGPCRDEWRTLRTKVYGNWLVGLKVMFMVPSGKQLPHEDQQIGGA